MFMIQTNETLPYLLSKQVLISSSSRSISASSMQAILHQGYRMVNILKNTSRDAGVFSWISMVK